MAAFGPSPFSRPAMTGDAVSVLVLVEDSRAMADKWKDIREYYLPTLLGSLRVADAAVEMRVWWLATGPMFTPSTSSIADIGQCSEIPDLKLLFGAGAGLSATTICRSIDTFAAATARRRSTRHAIVIASHFLATAEGPATAQGGIDQWHNAALALSQSNIRLHMILDPTRDLTTCDALYKRTLYLQNHVEAPVWFPVDKVRYKLYLSGGSLYRAYAVTQPLDSVKRENAPESTSSSTSVASSPEVPISPSPSTPSSPTHDASGPSRKASAPTARKSRAGEASGSQTESPGLVSYLQQMHGLTKKRSYGTKAAKRTLGPDMRLPASAGRPILPRLEMPSPNDYTYPTFPTADTHGLSAAEPAQSPSSKPGSSLVNRTSTEDRRARRHNPWLPTGHTGSPMGSPTAELFSSTPSSTTAALRTLESMPPRLTEFHTVERQPASRSSLADWQTGNKGLRQAAGNMPPPASRPPPQTSASWPTPSSSQLSAAAQAPASAYVSSANGRSWVPGEAQQAALNAVASEYLYGNSPLSSQETTPLPSPTLTAPTSASDNSEDQPFLVTPEYEAFVQARFEEALHSGAMHASMSSHSNHPGSPMSTAFSANSPIRQEHYMPQAYPPQSTFPFQPAGQPGQYSSDIIPGIRQPPAPLWGGGQPYVQHAPDCGPASTSGWYAP